MHAIEVAFESIHVGVPEAAELGQPGVHLLEALGLKAVEAALRVDGGFDEAGLAQDAEVFGNGGLGHAEAALDVADRVFGGGEQAEDGAAIGLGDDFEGGFHTLYIPICVYSRQGI